MVKCEASQNPHSVFVSEVSCRNSPTRFIVVQIQQHSQRRSQRKARICICSPLGRSLLSGLKSPHSPPLAPPAWTSACSAALAVKLLSASL